jgi:hypothetical protein
MTPYCKITKKNPFNQSKSSNFEKIVDFSKILKFTTNNQISKVFKKFKILIKFLFIFRPEEKENKEGADTEKVAEQDKNESEKELAKDKVISNFLRIFRN